MADVTLFAGPSAQGLPATLLRDLALEVRAPVRRGDVARLVKSASAPGVMVLCDGVFQAEPAVGHAEIGRALERGWQVWGVSSIGAIRAHEMRAQGMRGFGYVYEQFARFDDFTDDELCLLHLPQAPYTALTEALVNLRYALERQGDALGIGQRAQQRVIDTLRGLWFGDRSLPRMREIMVGPAGVAPAAADALLDWLGHHRVKSIDLQGLLQSRPWA